MWEWLRSRKNTVTRLSFTNANAMPKALKKSAPAPKAKSIADYFIQMPPKRKLPTPSSSLQVSKKSRLSSPEPLDSDEIEIPGSLSDEESIPSRHSVPIVTKYQDDPISASSPVPSLSSLEQETPLSYKHLTPPPSERCKSVSPIPVLTTEAKTAQVLASIRAKAAEAVAQMEPEDSLPAFKETLSDSDDDMAEPSILLLSRPKQDTFVTWFVSAFFFSLLLQGQIQFSEKSIRSASL
jgi:hypothetical protein